MSLRGMVARAVPGAGMITAARCLVWVRWLMEGGVGGMTHRAAALESHPEPLRSLCSSPHLYRNTPPVH